MPKPKELAKRQRRMVRELANRHVLNAIDDLAGRPPPELPPDLQLIYREQVLRRRRSQAPAPARSPYLAHGDTGRTEPSSRPRDGA